MESTSSSHPPAIIDDEENTVIGTRPRFSDSAPAEKAYLIVLSGANIGEMYRIDETITVGRGQTCQIRVSEDGVSREHAKVYATADGVFVEDADSTNGTYLNGERLKNRMVLRDGDKIQLGATTILKFTYHDKLEEQFQRRMYASALRDTLTQVFNRRYFLDQLQTELTYALRHKSHLALMIFDIDHFKRVNDTYGHLTGDYVLSALAKAVEKTIRSEDVLARYGGEEFVLLCRGIDRHAANIIAERIRAAVEKYDFVRDNSHIPVTISIGVAVLPDSRVKQPDDLIELADQALYQAKAEGRNRVVFCEPA